MSDQQKTMQPRPERQEETLLQAAKRKASDMRRKGVEAYEVMESLFGLVPSWLVLPEDAKAILAYAPPVHRRR